MGFKENAAISAVAMGALVSTAGAQGGDGAGAVPSAAERGARVEAGVLALPDGLHARLAEALGEIVRVEQRFFDLGLFRYDGTLDPEPFTGNDDDHIEVVREFLVDGEPGGFPGALAFEFGGTPVVLEQLVECARYHAGWVGAQRAFAEAPELGARDLLRALRPEVLFAEPLEGSELALRLHGVALEQRRFAPLGNGGLCYLGWGFLFLDGFWTAERGGVGARDAFVQALLRRGVMDGDAAWVALRVLQPPLAWNGERPGRGIAMAHVEARGRFGFTEADQRFVEGVRNAVVRKAPVEVDDAVSPLEPRMLAWWSATLLHRILRDRGTVAGADGAMRRGTLDERMQFWSDLAARLSFDDFRVAYLEELLAMGDRADEFGDVERIAKLRAAAAERALTPEEEKELRSLERAADGLRVQLVRRLTELLVGSGGELHLSAVAQTLAGPTEDLLAGIAPTQPKDHWLGHAWRVLGIRPSEQSLWVLEDHFDGRQPLPGYGLDSMLMGVAAMQPAGARPVLERAMAEGGLGARSAAIANPQWMANDKFEREWRRLAGELDAGLGSLERSRVGAALAASLGRRGDDGGMAKALLLESFEQGRWKDPADHRSWWSGLSERSRAGVMGLLSQAERASLVERGLAPPSLLAR